jgi:hypothetical protein
VGRSVHGNDLGGKSFSEREDVLDFLSGNSGPDDHFQALAQLVFLYLSKGWSRSEEFGDFLDVIEDQESPHRAHFLI